MEVVAVFVGVILVYLAFTEQLQDFLATFAQERKGYSNIPLPSFFIGLAAVTAPAYFIGRQNKEWAWDYILLILLLVATSNTQGLNTFANYARKLFGGKATGEEFKLKAKGEAELKKGK